LFIEIAPGGVSAARETRRADMKILIQKIVVVQAIAATFVLATAARAEDAARRPARAGAVCVDAESARLVTAKGVALVSRGGSFAQAHDGAELFAGDRLLIRGGAATLLAGAEVLARAGSGSLLTLDRRDGKLCVARASSSPAAIAAAPSGQASNNDDDRDCDLTDDDKKKKKKITKSDDDQTDRCLLILGGLGVGGVAGGVVAATSGGSDDKTPPLVNISPQ
jgi:hypothetical protein